MLMDWDFYTFSSLPTFQSFTSCVLISSHYASLLLTVICCHPFSLSLDVQIYIFFLFFSSLLNTKISSFTSSSFYCFPQFLPLSKLLYRFLVRIADSSLERPGLGRYYTLIPNRKVEQWR